MLLLLLQLHSRHCHHHQYKQLHLKQKLMFNQICKKCSQCRTTDEHQLALDCTHTLCLRCLRHHLTQNQAREMLVDELEIVCGNCTFITYLSVVLAYKLVRKEPAAFNTKEQQQSNQLVCMDCLDEIFTVQDYTNGRHRNHEVKSVQKALPLVRNVLLEAGITLVQSVNNLSRQSQKMEHYKGVLNDIMANNFDKIRLNFEKLKEEVRRKEEEVLGEYQQIAEQQMDRIETDIHLVNTEIERGVLHLRWIDHNLKRKQEPRSKPVEVSGYFIDHHQEIEKINNLEEIVKEQMLSQMQLVEGNRVTIRFEEFKGLVSQVRSLQLFQTSAEKSVTSGSSCLGADYFDGKRKEVLGSVQNTELLKMIDQRLKEDPLPQKIQRVKRQYSHNPDIHRRIVRFPKNLLCS